MEPFKQYRRKQTFELRPATADDIASFNEYGERQTPIISGNKEKIATDIKIYISDEDLTNGSPKIGDMIARNPKNHFDQWLVAKDYFDPVK